MIRTGIIFGVLFGLAACGDPLSGVDRISQVDLADSDPAAQALPTEAEVAREGFFGTDAARTEPTAAAPLADRQPSGRRGLGSLFGGIFPASGPSAGGATQPLSQSDFDAAKAAEATSNDAQVGITPAATPVALAPEPELDRKGARGGFLSRLTGGAGKAINAKKDNMLEVEYGTVLPYGVIARSCAAKRQALGRKVDAVASGHKLYDTNPGTSGPRTFYITGFDDGCPRQLTAAHALLGAPSFYEQLHYGPAGQHLAFGETDRAYETVKGRICGARKGKPCGSKMNRLERDTFFINAYERANDNTRWSEQLIHEGEVMATSMKSAG